MTPQRPQTPLPTSLILLLDSGWVKVRVKMLVKNLILKQPRDRHSVTAALKIGAKLPQQSSTLLKNLTLKIKAHTSRQKPSLVAMSLLVEKMCSKTSLKLK